MLCTITAAFPAEHFTLRGRQPEKPGNILVVHLADFFAAEPALCLFYNARFLATPGRIRFAFHESGHNFFIL